MEVEDRRKEGGLFEKIKNNPTYKKIKGIKNIRLIGVVFIIALALIIYSSVISSNALSDGSGGDTSVSDDMDSDEQRLASILSGIEGAGEVRTMITEKDGVIVGVLIVAEGAQNIPVMINLIEAASTALGVDRKIVSVYRMK
jgi:hypothetical protein